MKKIAYITGFLTALPAFAMAYPWSGGPCGFGMHGYFGYGGGIVMWVLTIAVLAFLVFSGIKMFRNQAGANAAGDDPLKVLKTRYAKGEITKEQFESMKKDIV
jgi:putative membrane protein